MTGRAPEAIYSLWYAIHRDVPNSQLGGILGDAAHFAHGGYHVPRESCPPSDYSVQLAADKKGAADCASALDVSLPPDLMITCTKRLLAAAKANDPRLRAVREFCGTLDGKNTYPWQLQPTSGSEGLNTWDSSHLWHIHVSILREYADDEKALLPIADVFAGKPLTYPPTDPRWSDTVTKEEWTQAVRDAVRTEVLAALRSVLTGGDHGAYTHANFPALVKDEGDGVLDRLYRLENPTAPAASKK